MSTADILARRGPAAALAAIKVNASAAPTVYHPAAEKLAATVELYAAHDDIPEFTATQEVDPAFLDAVFRTAVTAGRVYGRRTKMQRLRAIFRDTAVRRIG